MANLHLRRRRDSAVSVNRIDDATRRRELELPTKLNRRDPVSKSVTVKMCCRLLTLLSVATKNSENNERIRDENMSTFSVIILRVLEVYLN